MATLNALIQHNAHVDAKTNEGNTPLHYAAFNNQVEALDALMGKVQIETKNAIGLTAFDIAIRMCQQQAIEALLKAGAKIRINSIFVRSSILKLGVYGIGSGYTNSLCKQLLLKQLESDAMFMEKIRDKCCICLEDFLKDNSLDTIDFQELLEAGTCCNRFMHKACFAEWVKHKMICPLCNKKFEELITATNS